MALRYYANAPATTLAASCSSSQTSIEVASVTGLPIQYPYTIILDRGEATEEVVSVTNASGTTLTVTRAYDSTTAFSHAIGATVEHGISAIDPREANSHVNASTAVHGLSGAVVGDVDVQALSNKDLTDPSNTFPSSLATDAEVTAAVNAHAADTTTHGTTGDIVGTSDTQALTNKDLSSATNTFPTTAVKAASNGTVTLSGPQTVDGVSLVAGDRMLYQNGGAANGVYVVAAGAWTRDTAFDTAAKCAGRVVYVQSGTVFGGTTWRTSFKSTDTLGTTIMSWYRLADLDSAQTLSGKTLTSPTITSPTVTGLTLDGVNISDAWANFVTTWTGATANPVIGNGTIAGSYLQIGKLVVVEVIITAGATTTFGTGVWMFSLPVAPANISRVVGVGTAVDTSAGLNIPIALHGDTGSNVRASQYNGTLLAHNGPIVWASGDIVRFTICYRAA